MSTAKGPAAPSNRICEKPQNAKSVTDASIWVKFISKNSKTQKRLEIKHCLLNSPIIIPRLYWISFQVN